MSPEKHAIRDLEKQLEGATPEEVRAITNVIFSLTCILLNKGNGPALEICYDELSKDVDALELLAAKKRTAGDRTEGGDSNALS